MDLLQAVLLSRLEAIDKSNDALVYGLIGRAMPCCIDKLFVNQASPES